MTPGLILLLAGVACVCTSAGYVLCARLHRAAWDAERAQFQRRWDALSERWVHYDAMVERQRNRPRIRHVAELNDLDRGTHHGR